MRGRYETCGGQEGIASSFCTGAQIRIRMRRDKYGWLLWWTGWAGLKLVDNMGRLDGQD